MKSREELLTIGEAALEFSVPYEVIRIAVKDNIIFPVERHTQKTIRIPRSSLEAYRRRIRQNTGNPGQDS